ncbi:tRNA (adenosine(37)-N6)-threonylcarbamoyltransferase complex dimerization subunit type 1 TsaB [Bacillus glycinifermentans]|uniref:tRNA (Adenosine(37)-N6)-threonylcarbamoyltransferase complex dimerization subunit type 1 TsaB n=1 Tax=Bacillus glycinifermentans TaxID=1664069 RepID=A0A0T6BPZ9_9BACI|nr:tRNA (adenosine(37)-N6)-threonylcarbamoyltransferase complex dimerization subunit type 1 TsaB [Bacillus glycinifermentans]ATH94496.1 tRNA (adenosine(37)-N6)-threonylcarbamoyltransferase complex dimerization subunit type 1 TsaB [Bacillus glycinifermentans]KRT93716.1 tRNA threonylcarbamoyladenosine biosynthesis protein TsaB [Bacillus glycinifermentans]MEC0486181.1 tRNA (adenosine(37)-N6)-threonylcarbamoyltransferase complex dimerization subunit type 1 TsaB [Bacillus glycinifermentans]
MTTLAIDTSNLTLGVALVRNGKVIAEHISHLKKNHSVRAMPAIDELLQECGLEPSDLSKIAVAKGPGSYTGVRIGVTIAKTLAWSLNIPVASVSSLEVLAANGHFFSGVICPLFDARRGQVYTGLYRYDDNNRLEALEDDQNILLEDWLKKLKDIEQQVLFLGNDTDIHQEVIEKILGTQAVIGGASLHLPRPSELALIGERKEPEPKHGLVPNYIRLAEAEAKWLEKQK